MLKFLIVTLLAIQCNCQRVVEIGDGNDPRSIRISSNGPVVNGVSSLRTFGGLSSFGVQPVGVQQYFAPSAYGLGLSTIGGLRHSAFNYGLGQVAVRPAVNLVSAYQPGYQSAYQTVAVRPAFQSVAVQPAVQTIVQAQPQVAVAVAQPQVQTIVQAQPQVYAQGVAAHQQQVVPVSAAIHNVGRTVEYRAHPYNDEPIVPQVVEVEPSDIPLHIHFKSRSSTIQLSQEHIPGQPGTVEQTSSQDEPSKVIHEVVKPVIQEVREVIQPYRQLSQEINPVVENVHTVVSKGEGERRQYVAQPYAQVAQVAQVQVPQVAQIQSYQVQRPVAQVVQVAQPQQYAVQVAQPHQYAVQVAQPQQYAVQVAQPQQYGIQVAQPVQVAQAAYRTFAAQPTVGLINQQSYRTVIQPQAQVVAVGHQPQYQVVGTNSLLNSGILSSRQVGGAFLDARVQPVGQSVSFSRTYAEADRK